MLMRCAYDLVLRCTITRLLCRANVGSSSGGFQLRARIAATEVAMYEYRIEPSARARTQAVRECDVRQNEASIL